MRALFLLKTNASEQAISFFFESIPSLIRLSGREFAKGKIVNSFLADAQYSEYIETEVDTPEPFIDLMKKQEGKSIMKQFSAFVNSLDVLILESNNTI